PRQTPPLRHRQPPSLVNLPLLHRPRRRPPPHHPRPPVTPPTQSQQNLQRPTQRRLGAGEVGGEVQQPGRASAGRAEPSPPRLPGDMAAFPVPQPEDVNERTLRRVQPDRPPSTRLQPPAPQLEGACLELVQPGGTRSAGRLLPRGMAMSTAAGIASRR